MTGSMGFGDILPLPERLCAAGPDVQVLVLTGSNQELKEKLEARFGGSGRVRAVGFTDQVPLYMAASDVLLSKPGGLSSTEAAVFGIPLVHTDPIPGCETRNAAFFQERGMSLRAQGTEEIVQTTVSLMNNGLARQAMARMEKNARDQGFDSVRLDVFSQNLHAQRLYEKLGYKRTGEVRFRKGIFYLMEKGLEE